MNTAHASKHSDCPLARPVTFRRGNGTDRFAWPTGDTGQQRECVHRIPDYL